MEKKIQDNQLGTITLRFNPRATRYILKVKDGEVIAILPNGGNEVSLLRFIENNRAELLKQLSRKPKLILNESTVLQTYSFSLNIFRAERINFYLSLKNNILHIACPQDTDFTQNAVQKTINGLLQKALRHEAKRLLPPRLLELARKYDFTVKGISIQNSKSRWGSCSTKKVINLSLHLMLLPGHLIDYVLLHELCHTKEMNHGEQFWMWMNKVTEGKALALRKELKEYHPMPI